jgi:hypothetical protein
MIPAWALLLLLLLLPVKTFQEDLADSPKKQKRIVFFTNQP